MRAQLSGALHLVDLAGSERVGKSGAEGAALKEAAAINKSLFTLTSVFDAKAKKQACVPFNESKLTRLMEPCLSGNGKTLMLVNVAPEQDNAFESLSSLRFAKQVNQCDTSKPSKPKLKPHVQSARPQSAAPAARRK